MPFSVLFVCTGNVCRSPMAELLSRAWADPRAELVTSSAGVAALVGHGIDTSTASVLEEMGVDPSRHRARQFEGHMAADADLVLTAEAAHRDAVMAEVPTAFRRTFTLKEFARLARLARRATDPAEVVAELASKRGADGPLPPDADDLPDPYRSGISRARLVRDQVGDAVRVTLDVLGFAPRPPAPAGLAPRPPVTTGARPAPGRRPSPSPRPRPQTG